jgi:RNA polymerase sigma-70 factor (ECF subfamily)
MAVIATGQREEAFDLVQDAMLKLVKRYRHKNAAEWGPLFHTILQSTIKDWYRRQKVRQHLQHWLPFKSEHGDEEEVPWQMVEDPSAERPDEKNQQQQTRLKLDKALHELPLRQQQAFLLRQWEGLDVAATAQSMGCSEGSVKTHYSRAIQSLRNKLEGVWP